MYASVQSIRLLLVWIAVFVGGILSTAADNIPGSQSSSLLLQKVKEGLPAYDENAKNEKAVDSTAEVEPETTHLAPLVILGRRKSPKFDELALLTERALKAEIRQRYGSQFQYWEEKRLQESEKLQDYVGNLILAGDRRESAAIQNEIDRLLVARNSDWVSQRFDKLFNSRYR